MKKKFLVSFFCFSVSLGLNYNIQKMYSDFELQGIEEEKLNNVTYKTVMQRILMEEATASVSTNDLNRENEDVEYVV